MEVSRASDAVVHQLAGETRRQYFAPRLRLGITSLSPSRAQTYHSHSELSESIFVVSGEIEAHEYEGNEDRVVRLHEGDLVPFEPGPAHTLRNTSQAVATIVVVKYIANAGISPLEFREICASDRTQLRLPNQ
jgi:uncharacterized RmlC-like cupin family protein